MRLFVSILFSLMITDLSHGQNLPSNECNDWQNQHVDWIFCDDFNSGYPKTGEGGFFEYDDGGGRFLPVNNIGLNNSYAMSALWQTGDVSAGSLKLGFGRNPIAYMNEAIRDDQDFKEIYYRHFLKMQNGWQGNPYKLSRATVFNQSAVWSQAMIAHVWQEGSGSNIGEGLSLDPASCVGGATNEDVLCQTYNDFSHLQWLGYVASQTKIYAPQYADQWFCIETRVKLNDEGESNGELELWINEQLEISITNLDFVGNYNDYGINAVFLENYWNNGSPQQQERYIDNFVVSTSPIGCYKNLNSENLTDVDNNSNGSGAGYLLFAMALLFSLIRLFAND